MPINREEEFELFHELKRKILMAVLAEFQPVIDQVQANTNQIVALEAQVKSAPAAQDVTDTVNALVAAATVPAPSA